MLGSDFIVSETENETVPAHRAGIVPETRIAVIANRKSGTNARDSAAIDRAIAILGPERTALHHWTPGDDLSVLTRRLIDQGVACCGGMPLFWGPLLPTAERAQAGGECSAGTASCLCPSPRFDAG